MTRSSFQIQIWIYLALIVISTSTLAFDFARLETLLLSRFGPSRLSLLKEWQQLLVTTQPLSNNQKLNGVNTFFNKNIIFDSDINIWSQNDYWATPLETIGMGRGDCEDFAIAKYYSLLQLGIPQSQLRLIYVRIQQGNLSQAHMVLAYYPNPNGVPLVLDNIDPEIKPANQRKDLTPVFSFNSDGVWHGTGNKAGKSHFSRWQDLQMRTRLDK